MRVRYVNRRRVIIKNSDKIRKLKLLAIYVDFKKRADTWSFT